MSDAAYIEPRFIRMRNGPQTDRAAEQFAGAFASVIGQPNPTILTVTPVTSLGELAGRNVRGEYMRMDSAVLQPFASMSRIELPLAIDARRVFELRTYESPNETALARKIRMFDEDEIRIFRRCGIQPVFFGRTIVGRDLPSLTYMVTFESLAAREQAWRTFIDDSEWQTLRSTPGLTDAEIVSNVTSSIFRPLL